MRRIARFVVPMGFMLALASNASAASLWTPVSSGTTQTITAMAIPKTGEMIYVTSGGQIAYLNGSSGFAQATVTPANALGFSDVAMSPDGTHGVAVGGHGAIYDSTDSGQTWNKLATQPTEYTGDCPTPGTTTAPLADSLYSVAYAGASAVYITGNNDDVLKSTDGGATFTEVNKTSATNCIAAPGGSASGGFGDSAWVSSTAGFVLSNYFGAYITTTDGFGGTAGGTTTGTEAVNGTGAIDRLALDGNDPSRAWAIGGGAKNGSYFQYTINGGSTWQTPTYDQNQNQFTDIADSGTTVVAVGLGGDIYTSPDGSTFYRQIAAAPNDTVDWHAVAFIPGSNVAFVGGANGALVTTATANQTPDTTAPTGKISGPATLAVSQFGTFTAAVTDNPGGSGVDTTSLKWTVDAQTGSGPTASFAFATTGVHTITLTFKDLAGNQGTATFQVNVVSIPPSGTGPTSTSTGGATITVFKLVTVTGRNARYIPVTLSAKKPRKFVIKLQNAAGKTVATMTVPLLVGKSIVRLPIGAKVTSGTYKLLVRVYSTGKHSKPLGRQVKQVFVLS